MVKCKRCGFVYLNPIPDPDKLVGVWRDHPVVENEIRDALIPLARGDVANIRRFKASGMLLEIGCGYGVLLGEAQEAGFDVHGWEMNPNKCDYIRKRFGVEKVFPTSLWEMKFPDKTFDVVAMLDVIEHVKEVHELLAEIRRILKDDGIIYLNTLDFNGIRSRLKRHQWSHIPAFSHIYFFTCESLDRLLRSEGLKVQFRLVRPSPSPIRNFAKSALAKVNIFEELCVAATKL